MIGLAPPCRGARVFALATFKPALNFSQRMCATQLAEQHGNELTPTRQPLAAVLCLGFFDEALEVGARN